MNREKKKQTPIHTQQQCHPIKSFSAVSLNKDRDCTSIIEERDENVTRDDELKFCDRLLSLDHAFAENNYQVEGIS